MLAVQSDIAKYHCMYTQGAVDFHTPGFFDTAVAPWSLPLAHIGIHIDVLTSREQLPFKHRVYFDSTVNPQSLPFAHIGIHIDVFRSRDFSNAEHF